MQITLLAEGRHHEASWWRSRPESGGRRCGLSLRQPAPGNSGPRTGAAPAGVLTHSTPPGGVGAPPGDTTVPRQELADGGLFDPSDPWRTLSPKRENRRQAPKIN